LTAAFSHEGRAFRVRHDRRLGERLLETSALLEKVLETYQQLQDGYERMRRIAIDGPQLDAYLNDVFPDPKTSDSAEALAASVHRARAAHFYRHGRGNQQKGVQGTLWAAYNGVVDYIDHRKTNVKANDFSEARLKYVWFGTGATAKQRALVEALRIAEPALLPTLALQ
jgi:hypothetical protein